MVWAFAAAAPLLGALVAMRIPERFAPPDDRESSDACSRARRCGPASASRWRSSATRRWPRSSSSTSTSAASATAPRCSPPSRPPSSRTRLVGGWLPDRFGPVRCATGAGADRGRRPGGDRRRADDRGRGRSARWRWAPGSRCCSRRSRCWSSTASRRAPRRRDGHLHRLLRPRDGARRAARPEPRPRSAATRPPSRWRRSARSRRSSSRSRSDQRLLLCAAAAGALAFPACLGARRRSPRKRRGPLGPRAIRRQPLALLARQIGAAGVERP